MKNKNIKYTFWSKKLMLVASLATAISVSSCDKDLLDTVPKTQVLTNNMWLTDNLTDQGVTVYIKTCVMDRCCMNMILMLRCREEIIRF